MKVVAKVTGLFPSIPLKCENSKGEFVNYKRGLYLFMIFLTASVFTAGCSGSTAVTSSKEPSGESLHFTILESGELGFPFLKGKLNSYYVISNESEWTLFWEEADKRSKEAGGLSDIATDPYGSEVEQLKKGIDFDKQMVVCAVFEKATGGYKTVVKEIIKTDENVIVKLEITGVSDINSENTAPYQFVKVDKNPDLPVKFELSGETTRSSDIDTIF